MRRKSFSAEGIRPCSQHLRRRAAGRRQGMEDVNPHTFCGPGDEAVVKGLAWSVDLGRVRPAAPGLEDMNNTADYAPVIEPWLASRVGRKTRPKALKLLIIEPKRLGTMIDLTSETVYQKLECRRIAFVRPDPRSWGC